jgi:tetraacyldisaccharide 4'-kinase
MKDNITKTAQRFIAILLRFPLWVLRVFLSLIYGLVITLRNKCYDWHIFRSTAFPLPVIAVGNITAGGTGKTPHTELLVTLLRDYRQPAVLSRGYRRRTKGFRYVEITDTVATAGDEPLQLKQKFPTLTVAVDADRIHGIRQLMAAAEPPDIIILDDAFQHRRVCPSLSLLLIDYHRPLHRDHLLPWGRLRDRRNQLRRADIVCITKCPPHLPPGKQQEIMAHLPAYLHPRLFFTTFAYGAPQLVESGEWRVENGDKRMVASAHSPLSTLHSPFKNHSPLSTLHSPLLLTGIAHPAPLVQYLQEQRCPPLQHLVFRDHHVFTAADVRKINAAARRYPDVPIFTTEKDAVRLRETAGLSDDVKQRLFFLPVTVHFLTEESAPTSGGQPAKQEAFKKTIMEQLWNPPPQPSNNF